MYSCTLIHFARVRWQHVATGVFSGRTLRRTRNSQRGILINCPMVRGIGLILWFHAFILGQGLFWFHWFRWRQAVCLRGSYLGSGSPRCVPSVIQGSDGTQCRINQTTAAILHHPPHTHTHRHLGIYISTRNPAHHTGDCSLKNRGVFFLCFERRISGFFVGFENLTIALAFQRCRVFIFGLHRRTKTTRRRGADNEAHTCPKISHAKAWAAHKTRALSEFFIKFSYFTYSNRRNYNCKSYAIRDTTRFCRLGAKLRHVLVEGAWKIRPLDGFSTFSTSYPGPNTHIDSILDAVGPVRPAEPRRTYFSCRYYSLDWRRGPDDGDYECRMMGRRTASAAARNTQQPPASVLVSARNSGSRAGKWGHLSYKSEYFKTVFLP